jgi:hypothetical protein
MSLTLRLYNTSSPSNKINKDLTLKGGLLINLKNRPKDFNELDIDYTGETGSVALDFNYAHLVEYNLYFFAKLLPSNIGNNHNILHLELDPLMTYKNQILNLDCIIKRNTNKYNLYVEDEELQTLKKTQIQTKAFNHTFVPYTSTVITLVGSSYD